MNNRLRQIEAFLAVARTKNFTRAAEAFGLSQPALSALIMQFETELEIKLFDRTTRQVELTDAGRQFLPHAERIAQDVIDALASLNETAALQKGYVRLCALPSLSSTLVPLVLADFKNDYPDIRIVVTEALAEPLLAEVMSGRSDFGVGVDIRDRENLRFQRIGSDELVVVCHIEHALADLAQVSWKQLTQCDLIAMTDNTSVRRQIDAISRTQGIELNIVQEFSFMQTALGFVHQKLGVTILPSGVAQSLSLPSLVEIPLVGPSSIRAIGVLYRADRSLSPAANALVTRFGRNSLNMPWLERWQ